MASSRLSLMRRPQLARFRQWLDGASESRVFLAVAIPLFALYLASATWSYPVVNDAFTNSVTAWSIGTRGSVYLEEHEELQNYYGWYSWIVPAGESVTSKYPPGAPLLAAPLYALWPGDASPVTYQAERIPEKYRLDDQEALTFLLPPIAPAVITAALTTAVAIGLLAVAFVRVGGTASMSLLAAYLAGLGTSAWPVASGELWQHGPAMAWIALALVLSDRHMVGSGFAFGAAILTRPPLAIIAAATGVFRAIKARSLKPAILVGVGAAVGLVAFLAFNWWVFDDPSVSAGYGPNFQNNAFSGAGFGYLTNLFFAAFALDSGFLLWSPFLLVLLPGIRAGWRAAPAWARGAALGGVLYLLLQYKAHPFNGGIFLGYRYPLEALTAASPVLFLSYKEWLGKRAPLKRPFVLATVLSVAMHAIAAFDFSIV